MVNDAPESSHGPLARRHLRLGWWSLLLFLTLGGLLESMHGFKVGWYLDPSNEARRLVWRLAHAHGTLLALVHLAFAFSLDRIDGQASRLQVASRCLTGASILLPGGFFLGGLVIYGGDPGLGILLVPVGAALLFVAVLCTALSLGARPTSGE